MEIQVTQKLNIPAIVKAYGKRLTGFIRKRVNRVEDVEDILQEVYYQLAEADRLFQPIDQIAAWLFTVARSRITDLYRKKKPELLAEYEADDEAGYLIDEINDLFQDHQDSPETLYLRSMVSEEIADALSDLPPEQSKVFEMAVFKGMSFKEISKETGEPVNTLISRKRYAVLYLRKRLRNLYDELINY
jgi:RNA polymerase sigma factor (sigma-70 family)